MLKIVSKLCHRQNQVVPSQNEDKVGEEERLVQHRPDESETRDGQHGETRKADDARVDEERADVVLR
jgi:hypothetical protein